MNLASSPIVEGGPVYLVPGGGQLPSRPLEPVARTVLYSPRSSPVPFIVEGRRVGLWSRTERSLTFPPAALGDPLGNMSPAVSLAQSNTRSRESSSAFRRVAPGGASPRRAETR